MKVIVTFWFMNGYPTVGMNHRIIIDDGRIKSHTGLKRRIDYIVRRWHKSKINVPYQVRRWDNDEVVFVNKVTPEE